MLGNTAYLIQIGAIANTAVSLDGSGRLTMGQILNTAAAYLMHKTTGAVTALIANKWGMKHYANRGW